MHMHMHIALGGKHEKLDRLTILDFYVQKYLRICARSASTCSRRCW
jgi:hypothetical protein